MKTELFDRTLWFDGTTELEPNKIIDFISMGSKCKVCTTNITPEILQYNRLVPPNKQIKMKSDNEPFNFEWNIPDEFQSLDLYDYFAERLDDEIQLNQWSMDSNFAVERLSRVSHELKVFKNKDLFRLLRVLIYVINTLNNKGCVWGVGRGSSVSSYLLYLIGVHDIDSVKFRIDIGDFLSN